MSLNLNGWDMHDIAMKMQGKSVFEILVIYKEKEKEYVSKASEYIQAMKDKNEVAMERIKKECVHLEKEKCVIAIQIADDLSKSKR